MDRLSQPKMERCVDSHCNRNISKFSAMIATTINGIMPPRKSRCDDAGMALLENYGVLYLKDNSQLTFFHAKIYFVGCSNTCI